MALMSTITSLPLPAARVALKGIGLPTQVTVPVAEQEKPQVPAVMSPFVAQKAS
jgi:hypothetical protein